MLKTRSKGESSPVIIKSEPCNDDVYYIDKLKVEKKVLDETKNKGDLEYIKEDIKEKSLMRIKQEEIIIKDEIPSSFDTQTDLTDDNVILTEDIKLSPTSLNPETSIGIEEKRRASTFCKYKTSKKRELKQHIDSREKPSSNAKFQCAECEYETRRKGNLAKHMAIHTGERRFACNLCDFKTAWKSYLKYHMITHTSEKPFACKFCEYKTARKGSLNYHIMTHTGEKPFACNLCELKTTQKSKLNRHMLTHTGEKRFVCNLCEFKTAEKRKLNRHMMTHTGEQPFVCNLCAFKTAWKSYLKYHMTKHTDEKSFVHNLCDFKDGIMEDESLMEVKQKEISIKDEIPSSSATQNN